MAYGAMGGDGQPQTQAALFTRHVLYRQPLEEAVDRPRWLLGRTWGSPHTNLRLESRFDEGLIDRLLSAGHDVEVLADAYSDTMGHAGAVVLHPDGTLEGVHDPRADGGASGVCHPGAAGKAEPGIHNHHRSTFAPPVAMIPGSRFARPGMTRLPLRVVAPARLSGPGGREQDAQRKTDADAERDHRLGMPADLLAHHLVQFGGACPARG